MGYVTVNARYTDKEFISATVMISDKLVRLTDELIKDISFLTTLKPKVDNVAFMIEISRTSKYRNDTKSIKKKAIEEAIINSDIEFIKHNAVISILRTIE